MSKVPCWKGFTPSSGTSTEESSISDDLVLNL